MTLKYIGKNELEDGRLHVDTYGIVYPDILEAKIYRLLGTPPVGYVVEVEDEYTGTNSEVLNDEELYEDEDWNWK